MSEERKTQADEGGGLDALFRNTLGNHQIEPSGGIWKGISRKLLRAELARFNFTNLPKSFWIGTASVVMVGLIFLFNQIPDGKTTENSYSPIILKNVPAGNSSPRPSVNTAVHKGGNAFTLAGKSSEKISRQETPVIQNPVKTGSTLLASNNSKRITKSTPRNYAATVPTGTTPLNFTTTEEQSAEDQLSITGNRNVTGYDLKYLPILQSITLLSSEAWDTTLRFTTLNGITNIPLIKKSEMPQFLSFNMGITPELSVYRNTESHTETNYWLNAGMTYHAGRFSVQTGIGLGYVFDHGDYRVNYKSKDSIGYFTSIISFIITPNNEVVFTTKDIAVYDSLQHVADDRAISRYTYLQIPLLLGFQLFETNHFSLGIKAGPAVSFLIGSKEAAPFIDYPNSQLIRVENNSLRRVKINWEIQAALDLEYRLVKSFSIYAQPSYKHYFKPFETPESNSVKVKDPYSIGIEVGARFNFGLKKKKP